MAIFESASYMWHLAMIVSKKFSKIDTSSGIGDMQLPPDSYIALLDGPVEVLNRCQLSNYDKYSYLLLRVMTECDCLGRADGIALVYVDMHLHISCMKTHNP